MKILLKILVAPFALTLSLLAILLVFLFDICAVLLTIAFVILVVLGIMLITKLIANTVFSKNYICLFDYLFISS